MNNDGESSITVREELPVVKFVRFLPGGQTPSGFRRQPLIQFYTERLADRARDLHAGLRTFALEDIVGIKGLNKQKLAKRIAEVRHSEAKPKPKIRRRSQLH